MSHDKLHSSSHLTAGDDSIQLATNSQEGLMSASQVTTLEGVATTYLPLAGGTVTGDLTLNQVLTLVDYTNGTPAVGDVWLDDNHLNFQTANDTRVISTSNGTVTSDTTVANTVTETTIATIPISANEFHAGQLVRVKTYGRYSVANGTDTFTARVKIGGTTVSTLVSPTGNVTDKGMELEFVFTLRTIGASGTVWANCHGLFADNSVTDPATGTTTVDTTTSNDVTVTIEWSNALAGNSVTASQELLELLS